MTMRNAIFFLTVLLLGNFITAEEKSLLILGDSISAGYGIEENKNWVFLLQESFKKDGQTLKIKNASVSGDTTKGGLSRIDSAFLNFNPDYVLIELGGNDALRGYSLVSIKNNLEKIILRVKAEGAQAILMQIKIPPNYGKKYSDAFEAIYRKISKQENIPLFPFLLEKVALDSNLMQLDGIHPNLEAQAIIAQEVKESFLDLFNQ
tara:strand:- start:23539 stop:24156 length:618 start_codon:yes stop_codon:yes gene_type:complete